jgi:hypothetical protein
MIDMEFSGIFCEVSFANISKLSLEDFGLGARPGRLYNGIGIMKKLINDWNELESRYSLAFQDPITEGIKKHSEGER